MENEQLNRIEKKLDFLMLKLTTRETRETVVQRNLFELFKEQNGIPDLSNEKSRLP